MSDAENDRPPARGASPSDPFSRVLQSLVPGAQNAAGNVPDQSTLIVIVAANLIPAVGVLFFGWDAFNVVFLYWAENAILGVVTIVRMLLACAGGQKGVHAAKIFIIPFFFVHYGIFLTVHGVFVVVLTDPNLFQAAPKSPFQVLQQLDTTFWVALAALAVEHAYDTYKNYVRTGEYLKAQPAVEMGRAYGRIVVLHLAILGGGFLLVLLGVRGLVLLLVALKIGYEIAMLRLRSPNPSETYEKVVH
jgi:hypothetical protein